jgi:hypothetical protein
MIIDYTSNALLPAGLFCKFIINLWLYNTQTQSRENTQWESHGVPI